MNILVIGNGFDLEHGVATKYGDGTFKDLEKEMETNEVIY